MNVWARVTQGHHIHLSGVSTFSDFEESRVFFYFFFFLGPEAFKRKMEQMYQQSLVVAFGANEKQVIPAQNGVCVTRLWQSSYWKNDYSAQGKGFLSRIASGKTTCILC